MALRWCYGTQGGLGGYGARGAAGRSSNAGSYGAYGTGPNYTQEPVPGLVGTLVEGGAPGRKNALMLM